MTVTIESREMNMISNVMIANDHYTIEGLKELIDAYNEPSLTLALACVIEEGTLDTIIQFFIDNPDIYS